MNYNDGVQAVFSEDSVGSAAVDARELVLLAKKAMKANGGMDVFKQNLVNHMSILGLNQTTVDYYDTNDEVQSVVLENWSEEVLRFIALKTIMGDSTEPCQLFPGFAVATAWKVLLIMPTVYRQLCIAMGNDNVFDHDPTDIAASKVQERHRVKRYNATLRAYSSYFDQQPPALYWNFHKPPPQKNESIIDKILGGCYSFLSSPPTSESETETEQQGMSPSMPVAV